jgi:hypothetical protein
MPADIDRISSIIRAVDGSHSLGASALAEAILGHSGIIKLPLTSLPGFDSDDIDVPCQYQSNEYWVFRDGYTAGWGKALCSIIMEPFNFEPPGNPETRYVWELYDADDVMVASGDHPDLASACRDAAHYFNQYSSDGPHRYKIECRTQLMEVLPKDS